MEELSTLTRGMAANLRAGSTLAPDLDPYPDPFGIEPAIKTDAGDWIPNPEYEAAERRARVLAGLAHRGVPERYLTVEWDDLEMVEPLPAIRGACERISDIVRAGHSLILCGPAGSGKTQAAMLIARAAALADCTIAVDNIGRLATRVRAGYTDESTNEEHETRRLAKADVLILDDVGAGESGEAKIERRILYFVLEERQNARRPTVVTTNLTSQQLKDFLGDRLMNRLMPARVLNFTHGRNFRLPKEKTLWEAP